MAAIVKGGAVTSFGMLAGYALQFAVSILVIRLLNKNDYGLISLAFSMVNIAAMLSLTGFNHSLPKFISQMDAKQGKSGLERLAASSMLITLAVSSLLALLVYCLAGEICTLLNKSELASTMKTFALFIPPLAVINGLSAVHRGKYNAAATVIFNNVGMLLLRIVLILAFMLFMSNYQGIVYAYVASTWLACALFAAYFIRNMDGGGVFMDAGSAKELMLFSLPLLSFTLLNVILHWSVTLFLGYYESAESVGLFNAPMRITFLLNLPLNALAYIYLPAASKMAAGNKVGEIKGLYSATTKWAALATIPILAMFTLDAEFMVVALFGEAYRQSAPILQIISLGFAVHVLAGPNIMTLISLGRTRLIMGVNLIGSLLIVLLCPLLIPGFSTLGAAWATAGSMLAANALASFFLARENGVHPICKNYLLPLAYCLVSSALLCNLILGFMDGTGARMVLFALLCANALLSSILTGSVTRDEVDIIRAVELKILKSERVSNRLKKMARSD